MGQSGFACPSRAVMIWLAAICVLVMAMVVVGGITRLTESGLSIVRWEPISGTIPPLNEQDWRDVYEQYQRYPQFQKSFPTMSLAEFKTIFLWEYTHRLLGRLIGFAFLVPYVVFASMGKIRGGLAKHLLLIFVLGGLQGALGWYMVKSGLVDNPRVSHYRLAAHLALALALFAYALWLVFTMKAQRSRNSEDGAGPASRLRMGAIGYTGLVALQIVYGALTAGLRAGKMFNTFPLMAGSWVPLPLFNHEPFLMNFLANPAGVQFVHRAIGWIVLLGAAVLWLGSRRISLTVNQRRALGIIAATATVQFGLGIVTLLSFVNLHVAVAHQTGAFILFALSLYLTHSLTRGRATAPASTGGSNLVKA